MKYEELFRLDIPANKESNKMTDIDVKSEAEDNKQDECIDIISEANESLFPNVINTYGQAIHQIAIAKGWWDNERNDGELLALIHSEISEALEALRLGNPESRVIENNQACEELADAIIRILDMCAARDWNIGAAILAKMQYNCSRKVRHGKRF